jgi:hypothetical protein
MVSGFLAQAPFTTGIDDWGREQRRPIVRAIAGLNRTCRSSGDPGKMMAILPETSQA